MANLITGLFDTEAAAENAVAQLKQLGYGQNEISIIMRDRNAARDLAVDTGATSMEGVGTGAVIGGALGAVLAGLLAVGSIAIPGSGLLVAGPLAAALAGAGTGGILGGLLGWLVDLGVPSDVAPYYERGLNEGGVVVAVAAHPGDEARVQQILRGGSVAYAGYNTLSYVMPTYASRFADIKPPMNAQLLNTPPMQKNPPRRTYDFDTLNSYDTGAAAHEAAHTANSVGAEQRSDMRIASEHEREARREAQNTDPLSGAATAMENEWDRTKTALENQTDKVTTGAQNETDRLSNG